MKRLFCFVFLVCNGFWLSAGREIPNLLVGQQDSLLWSVELEEVKVTGRSLPFVSGASTPIQVLTKVSLQRLNVLQLSDAVKFFSGTAVKDYGGIGGLKTIGVRGLEAKHTAVAYDGVPVSDAQTGQVDLGRFSAENVSRISLSNADGGDIFQPARLFASGSVLHIVPESSLSFASDEWHVRTGLKVGSYGFAEPSLFLGKMLGNTVGTTFLAQFMTADGHYPFTLAYGASGDSTSREKRINTDVRTLRLESGWNIRRSDRSELTARLYWYASERGLPGAVILYNPHSDQRLWDQNFFGQFRFKQKVSSVFQWMLNGKWNWSYSRYLNPSVHNPQGKEENFYYQREYYLSGTVLYAPRKDWAFSWASDVFLNQLSVNFTGFSYPSRYTWLNAWAAEYSRGRWLWSARMLYTLTAEEVRTGDPAPGRTRLSPSLSFSYRILQDESLRFRAFYKQHYRLPTFNDLYYQRAGNSSLRPEVAVQWNAGLVYHKVWSGPLESLSFSLDGYYNQLKDKILAVPRRNLFLWSMSNIGKVNVTGLDVVTETSWKSGGHTSVVAGGTYSYQRALDETYPGSNTYRHQIPYTPLHSGSFRLAVHFPRTAVAYSCLWSGERYVLKQNLPENRLPGYVEHGVSVRSVFGKGKRSSVLQLELLNFTDQAYEVVRSYPMPGRNFRVSYTVEW